MTLVDPSEIAIIFMRRDKRKYVFQENLRATKITPISQQNALIDFMPN